MNRVESRVIASIEPEKRKHMSRIEVSARCMEADRMTKIINVIASTEDVLERNALLEKLSKMVDPKTYVAIASKYFTE